MVTNSPDISSLQVCVTWNLSGSNPQIDLVNMSTGTNLADVVYAFLIKSPSQTIIHNGNTNDPDIVGIFSNWTFFSQNPDPTLSPPPTDYTVAPWPRPFGQIEWSGSDYTIEIFAKDSVGNVFSYVVAQKICRPAGNDNLSTNTYGKGIITINMNCNSANAYFENISNTSYKGLAGTQESSVLKVFYPNDQTDSSPTPFTINNFSNALVPITYDSDNYEFIYNGIWLYEFPNCSSVLIKYYTKKRFAVNCNIDLCPLVCEYVKLIDQSLTGNCTNLQDTNEKLILINGKMNLALLAKEQPLCGIDLPALIEEIKLIGGWDCNCCSPSGNQPFNSANLGDWNFAVRTGCGDITGYPEIVGNNITFVLSDKIYIFKICNDAPTEAFTILPDTSGCTRTFCLNVNMTTLATDILNTIKNDIDLVNLFNSIVTGSGGGAGTLLVDGKCIFSSSGACDYTFTFNAIPLNTTFAILNGISSHGTFIALNFAFNITNLAALTTYLNGLGLGTFVITNLGSGTISIFSAANTHALTAFTYNVASVDKQSKFNSDCTGFVPLTANQVVQNIINYLCGITDNQMVTSQDYDICYINPATNTKEIVTVLAGTKENVFLAQLLDLNCDTLDYVISLSALTCSNIQNIFPLTPAVMQNDDVLLGSKAGQCARIYPVELGTRIFEMGIYNQDFVNAVCHVLVACQRGFVCSPYSTFQIAVVEGSPTNTMSIVVTFVNPASATTPPQIISNTIRYARVDNTSTPIYTTISNVLPGATPYTIAGLDDGEYIVGITPVYADGRACGEVILNTGFPTSGFNAFSSIFNGTDIIVSYNAPVGMPKVRVNINYPNGGQFSQIYNNTGADITITPPAGNYGTYTITMTPVYNEATGYFGQTTAPSIITVTPPNNSMLVNNTTNALTPISMVVTDGNNVITVPFNAATVAASGGTINFYLPTIQIASAVITFGTGTVGGAYFIASASYVGTITPNHITFNSIDTLVSGGATINLVDPSP